MEPDLMRAPAAAPRRAGDEPVRGQANGRRRDPDGRRRARMFLAERPADTAAPGAGFAVAQTQAVTTVIFFQIFYLLNCRSFQESILRMGIATNPWIFVGIGAVLVLQAGFVYLPFMNAVFGSAPLEPRAWLEAALVGLLIMPVIGVEKWWRRRAGGPEPIKATPEGGFRCERTRRMTPVTTAQPT